MIRSLISKLSASFGFCTLVFALTASPALAGSITLNDSNCDSFSLTGTPPNQILSCVVSNAPSGCTVAGPNTGTTGTAITLTSQCATGSANAWVWTGGNCAGQTTQSCSATSSSVGVVTYGVTPSNNIGAGNTATKDVSWTNTPPAAPSGCTLSANTASLPAGGGVVTLTANCSGGGAPTTYAWTGNNLPTPTTTNVAATSITTTTTFSVTPSNATGSGNTAQTTVSVAGSSVGNCGQYSNVLPIVNATWGQAANWQSAASGNFGDGSRTIWVFRLTVPPGTPSSSVTGRFTVSEFNGPTTFRQMTISATACDFRAKDWHGVTGPFAVSNGTTASVSYAVAAPFIFGPAGLTAGQTYYVNVRNWQLDPSPQSSCSSTTCNALMSDDPATP
jgi:hypothetical protein